MVTLCTIGDNVVDRYLDHGVMYPGGQALNVAVHARRSGVHSSYLGVFGSDDAARFLQRVLRQEDVDISLSRSVPGPNAYATVRHIDGERVFGESVAVNAHEIILDNDTLAGLARFDLLHTGADSGLEDELERLAAVRPMSYDFSDHSDDYARPLLPHVRVAAFSRPHSTDQEVEDLACLAHDAGVEWVLITRAELGGTISHGGVRYSATAPVIGPVDTLGAGDAFLGSALGGILARKEPQKIVERATSYASLNCKNYGAFGYQAADVFAAGPFV